MVQSCWRSMWCKQGNAIMQSRLIPIPSTSHLDSSMYNVNDGVCHAKEKKVAKAKAMAKAKSLVSPKMVGSQAKAKTLVSPKMMSFWKPFAKPWVNPHVPKPSSPVAILLQTTLEALKRKALMKSMPSCIILDEDEELVVHFTHCVVLLVPNHMLLLACPGFRWYIGLHWICRPSCSNHHQI